MVEKLEPKRLKNKHIIKTTTLTSNTMPNEVKESYSNLVNALYTIAVLMCTKMCHKATLCLQVGDMLPVSSNVLK